jgi:hypothetical protein
MSSIELNKHTYCKEKKKKHLLVASAVVSIEVNAETTKYSYKSICYNQLDAHMFYFVI